jgi:hypothetical protein
MESTKVNIVSWEVEKAIPVGTRAYIEADKWLNDRETLEGHNFSGAPMSTRVSLRGLWQATKVLATANKMGQLDPPLPRSLDVIIEQMDETAREAQENRIIQNT